MKKILFGSAASLMAVAGLSAFTAKHATVTSGWYSANFEAIQASALTVGTTKLTTVSADFSTSPVAGVGQAPTIANSECVSDGSFVCAAFFDANGKLNNDPTLSIAITEGDFQ
jgi:hypothetical protein